MLQPNYADSSLQRTSDTSPGRSSASNTVTSPTTQPQASSPMPTMLAVSVNQLWMTSLAMSLVAALFAITVYPWLREYKALSRFNPDEGLLLRELRQRALYTWGVPQLISLIPLLLEVAVIMFLVGLAELLNSLSYEVFLPFSCFLAVALVLFAFTLLAPFFYPTCPYKSPTSFAILYLAKSVAWLIIFLLCICVGAPVVLSAKIISVALRRFSSLGPVADAWETRLSIGFWMLAAKCLQPVFKFSMGRRYFGGEFWASREREALSIRSSNGNNGDLYASALSSARKCLPKDRQEDLMSCFYSLPPRVQLTVAVAWIAHALHTDSVGLMLREGTAVNSTLLRQINETFSDSYLSILTNILPSTWPGQDLERVCTPSMLLVLHTIIMRVPLPEHRLRWYTTRLMDLRRSQQDPSQQEGRTAFYRDLGDDRVDVRMPTTLLFEYNEHHPEALDDNGEYSSAQ